MSFHPPSIFRQASEPPLDSLSLDYSNDTAESSCGGIETWISDKRSSPEILWEDQSMRLFRFRQSKRDKSQKVTKPTKTGSNCPPRMSMSAETYKRQQPFLSTSADSSNLDGRPKSKDDSKQSSSRSSTLSRKHQSVSLELATAWMQMGEKNRQSTSNMSVSESTSYSSSSCGSSHDPAGYTRNTHHEEENKTKSPNSVNLPNAMSHPGDEQGEDAAYPGSSRSSLFVSESNRLLCQQRTIRDSESTSVRALRSGHSSSRDWVHSGKTETRGSTGPGTTRDGNNSNIKNNVIGSFSSARQRDAKSSSVFGNAKTSAKEVPCNIPKPSRPTNAPKGRGIFRLNAREGSTHQERSKRRASKERGEDSRRIIMTAKSMWRTAVDPASGRTYYYHVETRETQWRKPLELASDEEKEEMRKKEELQRSFFAAMEANILKNLETGATVESAQAASEKERTKNFLQTRSVEGTQIERPGLVRTISSMDRQIISELVKRQPSNRRLFDDHATSPNDVIAAKFRESTVASDALTDQTKNLSLEEYPGEMPLNGGFNRAMSEESMQRQASLGTILSNLPDDNTSSRLGNSYLSSIAGASFYDESADDFGVSDEEIDALTELAKISDRMSSIQDDGQLETTEDTSRFAPTGLRSSIKRASMTNNSLSVLREENEFSEHSTGNDSPRKDERAKMERERVFENMKDAGFDEDFEKPNMVRRNTCGTIYVGSTMSAPDKDATMKCICGVYRAHILQSEKENLPTLDEFLIFNDLESQQQKASKNAMKRIEVPSLEDITAFYRDVFRKSQMETDCIIMTLIYVERLIRRTEGRLRPRSSNWRSILFSCMILASKVWDDLSMWNADFSQTCPSGVRFSLQRINELEIAVLSALSYDVKVPASEYAKYYFLLRSMLIKSGLGSEDLQAMNPLDVEGAKRLQQMTARYQASQAPRPTLMVRSKSVTSGSKAELKARLEHMVQM